MFRLVIYITIVLQLLSACSQGDSALNQNDQLKQTPFLFRMNAMFTDAEKFLSFPLWFNDSLIAKNKISKMSRSLYFIEIEDTLEMDDLTKDLPREKRMYWFYPNGQVKQMKVDNYYDDEIIGSMLFTYKSSKDKYGFATVVKEEDQRKSQEVNENDVESPFFIHQKVKQTGKYLAYQDDESGDYLFYMLNKKYWGALSIDTILNPTPKDIIVLGSPYFPTKQYKVQNKVNEKDVQLITYHPKSKVVQTLIKHDYPFEQKRTLLYNKNGLCNGYVDSTFSGKLFLNRTLTDLKLDKLNRPIQVTHRKENQLKKTTKITIELIRYE